MTLHLRESMAAPVVERLGTLGSVHFSDLNGDLTSFKRHYTPFVKRCDEMEKKLAFFVEECSRTNTPAPAPRSQEEFQRWREEQARLAEHYGCSLLDYWESIINERHRDYLGLKVEREKNAALLASAGARRHVIETAVKWFECPLEEGGAVGGGTGGTGLEPFRGAGLRSATASASALEAGKAAAAGGGGAEGGDDVAFRHIAGLVRTAEQTRFARIVFRASVGHAAVRFSPIEGTLMDEKGEPSRMSVFAVLYRGRALTPKLERICAAFGAATHALPNFARPAEVAAALTDSKAVIKTTLAWLKNGAAMAAHTLGYLRLALTQWRMGIAREKATYAALNGFTRNGEGGLGSMSCAGWVLKSAVGVVREAIGEVHDAHSSGGRRLPYRLDFFAVVHGEQVEKEYGYSEAALQRARCATSGEYIGLPINSSGGTGGVHEGAGAGSSALVAPHLDLSGYVGIVAAQSKEGSGEVAGRTIALPCAPPTYLPSSKFMAVFQGIVNTYGVPRYGEANPALWTVVTFPFLFGVMFGDFGHALLIFIAACWMVWKEKELASVDNEMFTMAFAGRYMLVLMGLFSMYCGFIYNDFFSLGMTIGGPSRWFYPTLKDGTQSRLATWGGRPEDVYSFGVDPEWHRSENDLLFFNSLKMKMSVVLGVTQMTFGLFLRASNALYFKSSLDFWCEAVPQLVFMISMFGYMVFLIMAKWWIDWFNPAESPGEPLFLSTRHPPPPPTHTRNSTPPPPYLVFLFPTPAPPPNTQLTLSLSRTLCCPPPFSYGAGSPPALIDALINIALKPSSIDPPEKMFTGQGQFQQLVLFVAFACVPIMLFVKPYILSRPHAAAEAAAAEAKRRDPSGSNSSSDSKAEEDHSHGGHGHSFGDYFIHQAIESIEFVLGTVSNTASYLRLWALSLAHSQLATVFWERALVAGVETENFVGVFIGYAVFFGITTGVLLMMDVLECFLHALRLHWVEFQVCPHSQPPPPSFPPTHPS